MTQDIDPITLAVLAGRMEQIADEMDATLFRAAFNLLSPKHTTRRTGCIMPYPGTLWFRENRGCPFLSASCPLP